MTDPKPSSKAPFAILGVIALVVGSIGTCAYFSLRAKGERVGAIDLNADAPSSTVTLLARSTLTFRLDATLPAPTNENSSRATRNAVYDTLGESTLTLKDTFEGRAPHVTRCAAYDGRFVSASDTETEVAVHGIPLTCALPAAEPGRHVISAEVSWARGVTARIAALEIRAETR